ncbi:MAG TPA: hypothetical protein VD970_01395 [Acetobacteraceae bacterium]|nr:hypothetical protein [Acetobacteraceae bacterium]
MTSRTVLPTENTEWGFWGTMGERAAEAWPVAFAAIEDATGADPDAVRAFLDSRHGRHFADEVVGQLHAGAGLPEAIAQARATWMAGGSGGAPTARAGSRRGCPTSLAMCWARGLLRSWRATEACPLAALRCPDRPGLRGSGW